MLRLSGLLLRFDKDDSTQSKKLDEMDLDDILSRAEDHETTQTGDGVGASLGGESFLAQFANVSDIKNDMSWEDIIPLEERHKLELEEEERRLEESAANETRKRTHAQVSYEGMDVDQPAPPAPKKPKAPAAQRKTASQKAMELKERDVRVLIRSMQRWGDIRQRYDVIVCVSCFCNNVVQYSDISLRLRSPSCRTRIEACCMTLRMILSISVRRL